MKYVFAVFFPPLAVLLCGKPFKAILNLLLTLCFWIPGSIHAWAVASNYEADRRNEVLIEGLGGKVKRARSFRLSR